MYSACLTHYPVKTTYLLRPTKMNVCHVSYWQAGIHTMQVFPAELGETPDHCCQTDWQTVGKPTRSGTPTWVDTACIGPPRSTHHAHAQQFRCFM